MLPLVGAGRSRAAAQRVAGLRAGITQHVAEVCVLVSLMGVGLAIDRALDGEIELLWLTGELRPAKPTVPQEVLWGLHFFNETLFEAVPEVLDRLDRALAQWFPGERFDRPGADDEEGL